MTELLSTIKGIALDVWVLWGLRLGIVLLVLGVLLPQQNRRTILSKVIRKKPAVYYTNKPNLLVQCLDRCAEYSFLRHFTLKEDSDEYAKLEQKIFKAGGLGGANPNTVQVLRLILPPIAFIVLGGSYLFRSATKTVALNPTQLDQLIENSQQWQSLIAPQVTSTVDKTSSAISPLVLMWIFVIALLLYALPELIIERQIKNRKAIMRKELPIIQTFILIMLEAGTHTVYDILRTLLDTTHFFKPYLTICLNEYYIDPKRAIQNMADQVNDEEFQVICNGLKQAVDEDKHYTWWGCLY